MRRWNAFFSWYGWFLPVIVCWAGQYVSSVILSVWISIWLQDCSDWAVYVSISLFVILIFSYSIALPIVGITKLILLWLFLMSASLFTLTMLLYTGFIVFTEYFVSYLRSTLSFLKIDKPLILTYLSSFFRLSFWIRMARFGVMFCYETGLPFTVMTVGVI